MGRGLNNPLPFLIGEYMKIIFIKDSIGQIEGDRRETFFRKGEIREVGKDINLHLAEVFVKTLKVANEIKEKPVMSADNKGYTTKETKTKKRRVTKKVK